MAIFAVQYTYDERRVVRDAGRPAHRQFLASLEAEGTLLASGPYAGPADAATADGALLLIRAPSAAAVAARLDDDPFAHEGVISARSIRQWTPVFGPWG